MKGCLIILDIVHNRLPYGWKSKTNGLDPSPV